MFIVLTIRKYRQKYVFMIYSPQLKKEKNYWERVKMEKKKVLDIIEGLQNFAKPEIKKEVTDLVLDENNGLEEYEEFIEELKERGELV